MMNSANAIHGKRSFLLIVIGFIMAALLLVMSGCSTAPTNKETSADVNAVGEDASTSRETEGDVSAESQDQQAPVEDSADEPCYVVSNVIIEDSHGDQIANIAYTLDERGGTDRVVSRSTIDNGEAIWDYTLGERGLPEMVDFEFTSSEGNDAYQTVYEYDGVENGLPASESSVAEFMNENGMSEYEYVYDFEYENGYTVKSSYRIYEDGEELTTQAKSQTYDAETGVLQKYQSNLMTVNFKGKKNTEGQVQSLDFTIAGQAYRANCTYNDNGTIASLAVTMRGTGDGFTIIPEYTKVENPYPQVRANSKSFIWNGLTAELGL